MSDPADRLAAIEKRLGWPDDRPVNRTTLPFWSEFYREDVGWLLALLKEHEDRLTWIADATRDYAGLGLIYHIAIGTHDGQISEAAEPPVAKAKS